MIVSECLLSLPKTIYFNFKVFKLRQAIKLPILVSYRVKLDQLRKGCIELPDEKTKTFTIKLGLLGSKGIYENNKKGFLSIGKEGKIIFNGKAHFSQGISIRVSSGTLTFGEKCSFNRSSFISCSHRITFGKNIMAGWGVNIRDSDGHTIYKGDNKKDSKKEVYIDDNVWLCSNVDVLKGTFISSGSVVAYRSCVMGKFNENNILIGGYPAKKIDNDIKWEL